MTSYSWLHTNLYNSGCIVRSHCIILDLYFWLHTNLRFVFIWDLYSYSWLRTNLYNSQTGYIVRSHCIILDLYNEYFWLHTNLRFWFIFILIIWFIQAVQQHCRRWKALHQLLGPRLRLERVLPLWIHRHCGTIPSVGQGVQDVLCLQLGTTRKKQIILSVWVYN